MFFSKQEPNLTQKSPTVNDEEQQKVKTSQMNSPFQKLPKDALLIMFSFLNNTSLTNVAKTCKEMKNIADSDDTWKTRCQTAGISLRNDIGKNTAISYKQLYIQHHIKRNHRYYAVGKNITTVESTFSNSYGEYKTITKSDVQKSFPTTGEIRVFDNLKDAELYAKGVTEFEYGKIDNTPAVFTIDFKANIPIQMQQQSISYYDDKTSSYQDTMITYFKTDVKNVNNKYDAKMDSMKISFDLSKESESRCTIS